MKADLIEAWNDLDEPIEIPENVSRFRKKGKLKVVIHFEDGSYKEHYVKLSSDYYITIKKKKYLLVPKAIERGKQPCVHYYFNNPWAIMFTYVPTTLKASELWSKMLKDQVPKELLETLAQVSVDSGVLHQAIESNWLKSMYAKPGITTKAILLIIGSIIVAILVVLQITGVVDVIGWFTGSAGG